MSRLTVCLASCVIAFVGTTLAVPGGATERFLVAVVRDDGKLHPFGVVDNGRWKPAWRPVAKTVEVPIRLSDIPESWLKGVAFSQTWRLYPEQAPPRDITVTRPSWAPSFCTQQVLLDSADAVREPMRPPVGPFVPKHALATLGGGRVDAVQFHDAASPLLAALGDALGPHVDRAEEWRLRGAYLGVYIHPYRIEQRRTYPVQVITVHEGSGSPGPVAWFEAVRRYPRTEDPDLAWCDLVTYAAGWTYTKADGTPDVALVFTEITSCLLDTVPRRVPLGVVRAGDGATWVFEEQSASSGERVAVYAPPGRRDEQLLLDTPTGHCRS